MRIAAGSDYRSVSVVGVAITTDLEEGLDYLSGIGLANLDEVAIGNGWQNQQAIQMMWRAQITGADAPQVLLIEREMKGTVDPISLAYGPDSLIMAVVGHQQLVDWIAGGAKLRSPEGDAVAR